MLAVLCCSQPLPAQYMLCWLLRPHPKQPSPFWLQAAGAGVPAGRQGSERTRSGWLAERERMMAEWGPAISGLVRAGV